MFSTYITPSGHNSCSPIKKNELARMRSRDLVLMNVKLNMKHDLAIAVDGDDDVV